jgi:hypothetical protein
MDQIRVETGLTRIGSLLLEVIFVCKWFSGGKRESKTSLQLLPRNALEVVIVKAERLCSLVKQVLTVHEMGS